MDVERAPRRPQRGRQGNRARQRMSLAECLHAREERLTDELLITKYACPCADCHGGGRSVLRSTIKRHLRRVGRDITLTHSVLV